MKVYLRRSTRVEYSLRTERIRYAPPLGYYIKRGGGFVEVNGPEEGDTVIDLTRGVANDNV